MHLSGLVALALGGLVALGGFSPDDHVAPPRVQLVSCGVWVESGGGGGVLSEPVTLCNAFMQKRETGQIKYHSIFSERRRGSTLLLLK